jgi:hypothetical protein
LNPALVAQHSKRLGIAIPGNSKNVPFAYRHRPQ